MRGPDRRANGGWRAWLAAALAMLGGAAAAGAEGPPPAPVRVAVVGDIMLDDGPGHFVTHGGDPFADLAGVLQTADLSVGNLECVIATRGQQVLKDFAFLAKPNALPLLKRHFTALTLANNHTGDWGRDGVVSELELLEQAGIACFGAGRNLQAARRPLIVLRNGRRIALLGYKGTSSTRSIALADAAGVAQLIEADVLADIRAARREAHADIVLVLPHWGVELEPGPTTAQRDLAHKMIDAGASAVIGAHPHVPQTVDWYHGRPIIYSLGNCVFSYGPTDPAEWIGWVATLTFDKSGGVELQTTVVRLDQIGIPHLTPAK